MVANNTVKLLNRDGTPFDPPTVEIEGYYVPPEVVLFNDDIFISTVSDRVKRESLPRDQLEYRQVDLVGHAVIKSDT